MKKHLGVLLLGLAALPAFAANFSGRWALQSGGGGRGGPTILTLNQVGNEVTGSIGGRGGSGGSGAPVSTEVLGGKVEGNVLTFYVWTGNDQPVKTVYKGTAAGEDAIEFIVTGGPARGGNVAPGRGQGEPQKVTAKRTR